MFTLKLYKIGGEAFLTTFLKIFFCYAIYHILRAGKIMNHDIFLGKVKESFEVKIERGVKVSKEFEEKLGRSLY